MNFGSSYVYWHDEPEYEVISDEEYEEGMQLSDDSRSGSDSDDSSEYYTSKRHSWRKVRSRNLYDNKPQAASGRTVKQADTNVVSIDFKQLVTPGHMFTGDPVYCTGCKALLSHISKINKIGNQQVWACEFCGTTNNVHVLDGEIPDDSDIMFMLEPAPSKAAIAEPSEGDNSVVIFCVDVSSSMNDTTEIPGKIEWVNALSVNRSSSWRSTGYDSYRNTTSISRLMGVQAAVLHQLEDMIKNHPNRRVTLITFGNEVSIMEVGRSKPKIVTGETLYKKNKLMDIGKELKLAKAVKDTGKELKEKVQSLYAAGCTALGPALLISVSMAAKCPGSKVILCTDGWANEGVGKVDIHSDEGERFYEEVGTEAAKQGTSISVISFKGTDCKMMHLGKMADQTEGQINIVDPMKLTEEFSSILAGQITATNAEATIILHKQLYVCNEDMKESRIQKQIGNVTDATVLTFEYGIRASQKIEDNQVTMKIGRKKTNKMEEETSKTTAEISDDFKTKPEIPAELPFQLQMKYTNKEGETLLRVFTHFKPSTKDRMEAEKSTDIDVIGAYVQKQVASMVLDGSYTDARVKALTGQRLVWRYKQIAANKRDRKERKKKYKKIFKNISKLEHRIKHEQKREIEKIGRNLSESEGSDDENDGSSRYRGRSRSRERLQKKKQMRHKVMSDGFSHAVYRSRQARSLSRSRSRSRSRSPPQRGQRRRLRRSLSRSLSRSRSRSPPRRRRMRRFRRSLSRSRERSQSSQSSSSVSSFDPSSPLNPTYSKYCHSPSYSPTYDSDSSVSSELSVS